MLKLLFLLSLLPSVLCADVELHSAIKEDFYLGNWMYIIPSVSDKPEKARLSDIVINDTIFTVNLKEWCKTCPENKDTYEKPIYAFTNLYEAPDFKGTPYKFALIQNEQGVFISPKGESDIVIAIERIGESVLKIPVIHKEEFSALWHPKEKRFLFMKNPSYYIEKSRSPAYLKKSTLTSKQYLNYRLHEMALFYANDRKTKLQYLDFSDSYVEVEKVEQDGIKIKIRDLRCGRGKSNVIAGVCIKPAYLLDYYDCGKVTEAFIKNSDLILENGEIALVPRDLDNTLGSDPEFFYVDREDYLAFPQNIKDKIKSGTINEGDLPEVYRLTEYGGATADINILILRRLSSEMYHHKFPPSYSRCDPKTGKLQ